MPVAQATPSSDLRGAMLADHASIERRISRLVTAARMDDWDRLHAAWSEVERDLNAHLTVEEELMLPRFERHDAAHAAEIRAQHTRIRAQLQALGVDLDLHALRADAVEAFVAELKEHAACEERALYSWAQGSLGEPEKTSLLSRLKARLRNAEA